MKILILLVLVSFIGLAPLQAANWIISPEVDSTDNKSTFAEPMTSKQKITGFDNIVFPRLRMAVYGGFSGLTEEVSDEVPSELRSFYNDLRSGKSLGFDIQYYVLKPLGVGFKYDAFRSKASKIVGVGTIEGDLSIKFVGPVVSGRILHSNDKNAVYFNAGYGYVNYELFQQAGIDVTIKGNTWASVCDLGYEWGITRKFAILIQSSYLSGKLKKIEREYAGEKQTIDLEKKDYESLNRFDFSLGLRFNL